VFVGEESSAVVADIVTVANANPPIVTVATTFDVPVTFSDHLTLVTSNP